MTDSESEKYAYDTIESLGLTYTFQAYAVIECSPNFIDLKDGFLPFDGIGKQLSRETIGLIIVCFDLLLMFSFLLAIWTIVHNVKNDVQRHRSKLFETTEFAMEFTNFPKLD